MIPNESDASDLKDDALGVPQVARFLGIGQTKCRALIRHGEIPSYRIGDRVLVQRSDLDIFRRSLVEVNMRSIRRSKGRHR